MADTNAKLIIACQEARRFLSRADTLLGSMMNNDAEIPSKYDHPKESGAVRRASMDLTRALADYRKP